MRSAGLVTLLASALLARAVASRPVAPRVTFTESIAPIVFANCVTCHRPGEAAPFSLISYEDVMKRGELIVKVTQSRYMPPWRAAHGYGEFKDERRLTDDQIATIAAWVKEGMPRGDAAKMPKLPEFADGWQLGKPDLILEMPEGFDVPASGPDVYRNFALPTGITEDRWVRAVEYRPSSRRVVHHALFGFIRGGAVTDIAGSDGQPGFRGLAPVAFFPGFAPAGELGGWAVGATPRFQPDGLSMALPKNSDFVLQLHFHPTGKPETERSRVGLYFADTPPDRKLMTPGVPGLFGLLANIDIPPGEKNYTIDGHLTLQADMRVYGADAHAHYLGKEMKATATLPDGSTRPLLWITDWDFNWQDRYIYKEPILLPKGTKIDVTISYDNSAENPRNPNSPPKRVLWGVQSLDEMGIVRFQMAVANKEDEPAVQAFMVAAVKAAISQAVKDGTLKRLAEEQRKLKGGGGDR
ncbi:MAG TPA: cytochrome c [Vicinamibacterales bacterium]|jgi:mono/diheme cytochrome c family protein|nr:cytochrome c [Vicinamibacterales bacterium]